MHDANGTPLKKGDKVMIPATIIEVYPTEDYCNVTLQGTLERRPDNHKETMTMNTASMIKVADADITLGL